MAQLTCRDITADVVCNVTLIQFGPDQGIAALLNRDILIISVQCSFRVDLAPVNSVNLTLPYPVGAFRSTAPVFAITAAFDYQFGPETGGNTTIGTFYQDSTALNVLTLFRNNFVPWLVDITNIYIAGQVALPLVPNRLKHV